MQGQIAMAKPLTQGHEDFRSEKHMTELTRLVHVFRVVLSARSSRLPQNTVIYSSISVSLSVGFLFIFCFHLYLMLDRSSVLWYSYTLYSWAQAKPWRLSSRHNGVTKAVIES